MAKRLVALAQRRPLVSLLFLCFLAAMPGFFSLPPLDRDESRFAQATKQMLESGQYVDIRFQNEVRYKKPVGIYWLQALAVKAGEAACGIIGSFREISTSRIATTPTKIAVATRTSASGQSS